MAVLEGVEGIPVLFVAWDQPDVFRLGTGFEFQTLVWNCLKCQRKYCFLQLNTTLALSEWLTTFYLETPYASVADVYICISHVEGGKTSFGPWGLPPPGESRRRGPLRWVNVGPAPVLPPTANPLWTQGAPDLCVAVARSMACIGRIPRQTAMGSPWGAVGGEGLASGWLAVAWHHWRMHKDRMLASCYSGAMYTKKTLRNKGLLYGLISSARGGKKDGMYMMLSAELFINRDIFRTFSWVSAAR